MQTATQTARKRHRQLLPTPDDTRRRRPLVNRDVEALSERTRHSLARAVVTQEGTRSFAEAGFRRFAGFSGLSANMVQTSGRPVCRRGWSSSWGALLRRSEGVKAPANVAALMPPRPRSRNRRRLAERFACRGRWVVSPENRQFSCWRVSLCVVEYAGVRVVRRSWRHRNAGHLG